MLRKLTIVLFIGLAGCTGSLFEMPDFRPTPAAAPVPAPVVNPMSAKERFVNAVEANGCVMTPTNVSLIMDQATLGEGDLRAVVPALVAEGRAEPAGQSGIRVITTNCP